MSSETTLRRIADTLRADDGAGGIPKYQLLHNRILAAIEAGDWAPGEKLPPESAFSEIIPLSLGTIQKALKLLADEGVVVRRHRNGTFVAGALTLNETTIYRFLADDGITLLPIYTYVLDVVRSSEFGPWTTFLSEGTDFVRFTRRISVNLEFECYNRFYLPADRFAPFLDMPVHKLHGASLVGILAERHNAPVLRTLQRVQATELPKEACAAIGAPVGTVGMVWEVLAYSYRDAPLAYQRVYMPPNSRRLEIRA